MYAVIKNEIACKARKTYVVKNRRRKDSEHKFFLRILDRMFGVELLSPFSSVIAFAQSNNTKNEGQV